MRDAQGNVMAVYEKKRFNNGNEELYLQEQHLYGSSRLGMRQMEVKLADNSGAVANPDFSNAKRLYELNNHLSNVLAVISDKKIPNGDGTYRADIVAAYDYYPFGAIMPSRSYKSNDYRYAFNAKERDTEGMGGSGSTYDYGFRIYNPNIARFLSKDPLAKKFPWWTPYQFAGNMPIRYIDLDGLEPSENPATPGTNEKRAMFNVSLINTGASKKSANDNFLSRSTFNAIFRNKDLQLEGQSSNWGNGDYITDTPYDPNNNFNMKVNDATIFNVDESQADRTNNYESFVVGQLLRNFVSGEGPENYNFPENGIISSKFLDSDILKAALTKYNSGQDVVNEQFNFRGGELANDVLKTGTLFSITGFTGSAMITMVKTDKGVRATIFNITSLYSGDLGKDVIDIFGGDKDANSAKSYVREPNKTTPYGNISQTYNLFIPKGSPLLKR